MDTLDTETLEQIKQIVNTSKNEKIPLEKPKKSKKIKEPVATEPVAPPQEPEPVPQNPVAVAAPVAETKKKRVQSEKQKQAFVLLQQKRKEQVEKLHLVKKINASKLLLENDVKLQPKKPKKIVVDFSRFKKQELESDSEDDSSSGSEGPGPLPDQKQWGTSTRNAKSNKPNKPVKPVKPVKLVDDGYKPASYF